MLQCFHSVSPFQEKNRWRKALISLKKWMSTIIADFSGSLDWVIIQSKVQSLFFQKTELKIVTELLKIWMEKEGLKADFNSLIEALIYLDQRLSAENIIAKAIINGYFKYEDEWLEACKYCQHLMFSVGKGIVLIFLVHGLPYAVLFPNNSKMESVTLTWYLLCWPIVCKFFR